MWPSNDHTKACASILSNTVVTHSVPNAYIIMNVMGTKWDMHWLRKGVSSDKGIIPCIKWLKIIQNCEDHLNKLFYLAIFSDSAFIMFIA